MNIKEIIPGKTYVGDAGEVRRIYKIEQDFAYYEMISGTLVDPAEAIGLSENGFVQFRTDLVSFATWAKKMIGLITDDDDREPTVIH